MKKLLTLVLALTTLALVGCGGGANNSAAKTEKVIKVGASPVPHAEILEAIKPELEKASNSRSSSSTITSSRTSQRTTKRSMRTSSSMSRISRTSSPSIRS